MMRSTEGARRSTLYPDRVPERAALYRRYRSQTFAEVIGQEHVTRTLRNAISSGQVAHAYLLAGSRGIGKTSIARMSAKAVNCTKTKDGDPCDTCESCVAIREGRFLDLIEIDAASNRGIDEMRDLREKVRFAPSMGQYKVYVIDEAHQLTNEAFNALLKTLEEPPAHVIFVLATTEAQRIPATIVSRTQRFDLRRIPHQKMIQQLAALAKIAHRLIETEQQLRTGEGTPLPLELALLDLTTEGTAPAPAPKQAAPQSAPAKAAAPAPAPTRPAPQPVPRSQAVVDLAERRAQQPAASTVPPAAGKGAASPGVTLQKVRSAWDQLLERAQERSIAKAAQLVKAEPVAIEGGTIVLAFSDEFARQ